MKMSVSMPILLAVACNLASSSVAPAYTVKFSVGCEAVLREDANEHYREYNKWWLMGYFTGRNYADDAEVGNGADDDQIYAIALRYCHDDPSKDWDDAALHTYDRMR